MTFSNQISISDIINIVLTMITLGGMILTFKTLKEMRAQRLLSIKPHIVITNNEWVDVEVDKDGTKSNIIMEVNNIGAGVAKNIEVEYIVDLNQLKNNLKVDKENDIIIINNSFNIENHIVVSKYEKNFSINSVAVSGKEKMSVKWLEMIIDGMVARGPLKIEEVTGKIKIGYKDLLDNKYESIYKFIIKQNMTCIYPEDNKFKVLFRVNVTTIKSNQMKK